MIQENNIINYGKSEIFQYHFLKNTDQRYQIVQSGQELVNYVKGQNHDTLIFVDRSARPISWLFTALFEKLYPTQSNPNILFINAGQKNLRDYYMHGIGNAVRMDGNYQFVGNLDEEDNIALFKQRVRSDEKTKQQLINERGKEGMKKLTDKNILIIDDIEFEGVTRLFLEEIIDEVFSPQSIDYFEYGEGLAHLPTGLSEEKYDPSFIVKLSKNPENILDARIARRDIFYLVAEL